MGQIDPRTQFFFKFCLNILKDIASLRFWWRHRWTQNTCGPKFLVLSTRFDLRTQKISNLNQ